MELSFKNHIMCNIWRDLEGYAKLVADRLEKEEENE